MDLQFVDLDSARSGCCVVMAGGLCRTCGGHRSDTFEVVGAEVAQSAVAASGVVPAFQEFEDCHPCFGLGLKRTPVDEFVLEGGEKAFRHRVVKAVAWNPAGGFQGILESRSVRSVRSVRSAGAVADVIREHEWAAGGSESAGDRIGCEALANDGATGLAWPAKTSIPAGLSTVVEAA